MFTMKKFEGLEYGLLETGLYYAVLFPYSIKYSKHKH